PKFLEERKKKFSYLQNFWRSEKKSFRISKIFGGAKKKFFMSPKIFETWFRLLRWRGGLRACGVANST
ncbi:MAG: hypothetical protein LBD89_00070, partial [Tannerellaceae bacterium]|nr:hypothetical protein [Tannerellaceae bacterium]